MNTLTLQIFSLIGVAFYFVLIIYFLKRKSLSLKYTIMWLILGVCMLLVAIAPKSLEYLSKILGIESPVNALFSVLLFFVLAIMMTLTAIVSRQSSRIRVLIQENALLEARVRRLEINE